MNEFFERIAKLSAPRLALLAAELNDRVTALEQERSAPIAIVGMACRYPGGVHDADSFWQLLHDGEDAIREVPRDRWDAAALYDPDPETPGRMNTRWGGFLDRCDQFDPKFFGIAPAEAAPMDPQQRLLLETVWEALENAAIPPMSLSGTATAVFTGICNSDYSENALRAASRGSSAYLASGLSHAMAAGRISYLLGLEGPSLAVDTSCSASLMAVHLACQSLRRGESVMALAGGVNIILNPDVTIALSHSHMMAPDGRCKAFSDQADGFVRAEGCGVVVLKRLADARRDGNRVLAVIRGTAVNQDGRSSGLTAPNGRAQQAVIAAALTDAGISPDAVQYVEAHGTGTALGDPIEIGALADVFAGRSPEAGSLRVGSVKSNLGHLESAAGIAGLMKLVLALDHAEIPASLHCGRLNRRVEWERLPLRVAQERQRWPDTGAPRVGGVSSFGFSGTNVHLVVEQAPALPAPLPDDGHLRLFALSARTPAALGRIARRLAAHLEAHPELTLAAIARTLAAGRTHFEHRAALIASTSEELVTRLLALADNPPAGEAVRSAPQIGFVFDDPAAMPLEAGRAFYAVSPAFRSAIDHCDTVLGDTAGYRLAAVFQPAADGVCPPAMRALAGFAMQHALAALWRSTGLHPAFCAGYRGGALAAACCADAIDVEGALLLLAGQRAVPHTAPRSTEVQLLLEEPPSWLHILDALPLRQLDASFGSSCLAFAGDDPSFTDRLPLPCVGTFVEGPRSFVETAAALYRMGCAVDVGNLYGDRAGMVALPAYPFERERYWLDAESVTEPVTETLSDTSSWLYEMKWEPQPLRPASLARVAAEGNAPPANDAVLRVDEAGEKLQAVCGALAASVLEASGYPLVPGESFTTGDLRAALGVVPRREAILNRLLDILVEDSVLHREGDAYRVVAPGRGSRALEELAAIGAACPEVTTEIAMLTRCVRGTPAVLAGRSDPMQLVFAEGSVSEAEQIYENSPVCRYFNEQAAQVIARAVEEARGHSLRILEIGSGTGATTSLVLPPAAQGGAEYTFTDISPVFLARGRKKFSEYTDVRYSLLNIERPPREQGFVAGGYDVVLAANVLHATADLRQTVRHVRELLRPGGLFMLIEGTRPDRWLDMTFGLTDGWWRVADRDLRPRHPLVTAQQWESLLAQEGITLRRTLQYAARNGSLSQQALLLASVDELEATITAADRPKKHWIVVPDSGGVGDALVARLRERGKCCEVFPRDGGDDPALQRWLDPESAMPLEIVDLSALDTADADPAEAMRLCVQQPLGRMQALFGGGLARLWPVTRGAQAVDASGLSMSGALQATLWGVGRTFSLEAPRLAGRLVDLDPAADPQSAAAHLLSELFLDDAEDQVAWREGRRYLPRLHRAPDALASAPAKPLRNDGAYLITGGLGAVGLVVAEWAARAGARHLVLVGRTGTAGDPRREQAVARIRAAGATVTIVRGDVSSPADMERLFALFGRECPKLRGVFHAATIQGYSPIPALTPEQAEEMLRPKVQGTLLLHAYTRGLDLDFFLLFSSSTSLLGAEGMAHYAAANQFLDSFATMRRAEGLPTLAVNWGAFEGVGQADRLQQMGLRPMPSSRALSILPAAIASPRAGLVVADIEWDRLKAVYQARRLRPMLLEVAGDASASLPPAPKKDLDPLTLQEYVSVTAADVLGLPRGECPADVPLTDLGLDSLMAVDLRNRLQTRLGRPLSPTIVFDYPTLSGLTSVLDTLQWAELAPESSATFVPQEELRI